MRQYKFIILCPKAFVRAVPSPIGSLGVLRSDPVLQLNPGAAPGGGRAKDTDSYAI